MIEIRDVDLADEDALHRWWEVSHEAQRDRPVDYFPTWEVARVGLRTPHPDFHVELFAAYDGDRMIGTGLVNLPMTDNRHLAHLDVYVDWPDRRRGVGTALIEEVERRARAAGRTTTEVEVFAPPDADSPGTSFAQARGYRVANHEEAKAVSLPEAEGGWAALEEQAAAARRDYRVELWADTVPDAYAEGLCRLLSRFIGMVPTGELQLEDGEWTVDRLRAAERRSAEIGQRRYVAAAVAPDGELVGWTENRLNAAQSGVAFVNGTMVVPEHRGHRLGLAMKLATHRVLRAAYPECELIVTSNADVNAHMNAINEAMGYRVIEQLWEFHKRL